VVPPKGCNGQDYELPPPEIIVFFFPAMDQKNLLFPNSPLEKEEGKFDPLSVKGIRIRILLGGFCCFL